MVNQTFNPDDFDPNEYRTAEPPAKGDSTHRPDLTDDLDNSQSAEVDFAALSDVTLLRGRVIKERYILAEHIAEGGFGAVFKGTDKQFPGKAVAIKLALDPATQKYFVREAKMMGQLKSDFIVDVYDYGFDRGIPYIVMEFLDGKTLDELLIEHRYYLPDNMVAKCVDQVGRALETAHTLNLVHRDLKPKNIMLVDCGDRDDQGEPVSRFKILDFGIASKIDASDSVKNVTMNGGGTPEYMSPEQIRGAEPDQTSDVFTFGVLIYQLLTGHVPFSNRDYPQLFDLLNAIVQIDPPRLTEAVGDKRKVPAALDQLVHSCLEKDPAKRPTTIREVRHKFRSALNLDNSITGLPVDYDPPPVPRRWGLWLMNLAAVIGVVAAGMWWLSQQIEVHAVPQSIEVEAGGESEIHLIARSKLFSRPASSEMTLAIESLPEGMELKPVEGNSPGDLRMLVRTSLESYGTEQTTDSISLVALIDEEDHRVQIPVTITPPQSLWDSSPLVSSGGLKRVYSSTGGASKNVYPTMISTPDGSISLKLINPEDLHRKGPRYPYYMATTCISGDLYAEFLAETSDADSSPSDGDLPPQTGSDPQHSISYLDCLAFVNWLNTKYPLEDRGRFRMASWDEWWASMGYFTSVQADDLVVKANPFQMQTIAPLGFEWTSSLSILGKEFDPAKDRSSQPLKAAGADPEVGPLTYRSYEGTAIGSSRIYTSYPAREANRNLSFRVVFEPN
ncbi:Serine/threonine-protein kinase PknL [Thalassoglobus neptunius]|uniref:non-specific serine/threonine protein kinase n=1 Tax=Thalassoglobus neptunius TaxID=1938619 RepID=A0A5C5X442_9PLAN|nr:serine/threonine-protein kinase [Thalassoglobus neptunius]TWT56993.1 Serine/threonine-protein kinase PknL [Thalassoglobus neptunius]